MAKSSIEVQNISSGDRPIPNNRIWSTNFSTIDLSLNKYLLFLNIGSTNSL